MAHQFMVPLSATSVSASSDNLSLSVLCALSLLRACATEGLLAEKNPTRSNCQSVILSSLSPCHKSESPCHRCHLCHFCHPRLNFRQVDFLRLFRRAPVRSNHSSCHRITACKKESNQRRLSICRALSLSNHSHLVTFVALSPLSLLSPCHPNPVVTIVTLVPLA